MSPARVSATTRRGTAVAALAAGLVVLIPWVAFSAPAGAQPLARAAARACGTYPRPGSTSAAAVPAGLRRQYGVFRRPQRASDQIAVKRLGSLPENGILTGGIRFVGRSAYGGRAYLVPSLHLLSSPLAPVRCLARSQRALQRALLPNLRREYGRRGLCLVIVYKVRSTPACQSAPGPVASLLYGPGTPGLGIVPDGVPEVRLSFNKHAPVRAVVHDNFWIVVNPKLLTPPCGLDWLSRGGIVLRTIASCNSRDTD